VKLRQHHHHREQSWTELQLVVYLLDFPRALATLRRPPESIRLTMNATDLDPSGLGQLRQDDAEGLLELGGKLWHEILERDDVPAAAIQPIIAQPA
jgi:hypothetical protein